MNKIEITTQSYGKVYKTLHWLLVLNIGATLIFSYGMSDLSNELKAIEYGNHAVSVTTIFILMAIRAVWRLMNPPPPIPVQGWQKRAAEIAHLMLYVLVFLQIVLGVLLASTTEVTFATQEYGINYTDWALVPESYHDVLLIAHKTVYFSLLSLILIHIAAALKHHFIDGDNVLRRMLPFAKTKIQKN